MDASSSSCPRLPGCCGRRRRRQGRGRRRERSAQKSLVSLAARAHRSQRRHAAAAAEGPKAAEADEEPWRRRAAARTMLRERSAGNAAHVRRAEPCSHWLCITLGESQGGAAGGKVGWGESQGGAADGKVVVTKAEKGRACRGAACGWCTPSSKKLTTPREEECGGGQRVYSGCVIGSARRGRQM